MALGMEFNSVNGEEGPEVGFVRYSQGLRRKRIVISNEMNSSMRLDSEIGTALKRQCSGRIMSGNCLEKSPLESLPQDILIRILCGVNHEDLEKLYHVSKTVREATMIAKESHFAFSTPRKTPAFRNSIVPDESSDSGEIETPEAPKVSRPYRARLSGKRLAAISVALFA
ncbi:hypothetical protein SLE2022_391300 [Rubroshorea leprosula]